MADSKQQKATFVKTGLVRFSYPKVFTPEAMEGSTEKKYSISLIIPKSDKATIAAIKLAIDAAKEEGKSKLGGKIPANLKTPLRDGDTDREDDEAYENCFFINASSKSKPGVVNSKNQKLEDEEDFYAGCWGRATVNFYAFNTNGNKGIAAGLGNLMKVKDGDALSGRTKAEDDFADDFDTDDADDMLS